MNNATKKTVGILLIAATAIGGAFYYFKNKNAATGTGTNNNSSDTPLISPPINTLSDSELLKLGFDVNNQSGNNASAVGGFKSLIN